MSKQGNGSADEVLVVPDEPNGTAALLLAGSSGRVDVDRARLLSTLGATVLAIRWFGGAGQSPGTYEVPLETFTTALDRLAEHSDRLVIVGTSFGAEAALVTAVHDGRVDAVVAIAPSAVVWAGVKTDGLGRQRQVSHWTWEGRPLPFVPFDESWQPDRDPPSFRLQYEGSLAMRLDEEATIPVERIAGEVVLVAGEDDEVWPSALFARMIADRRHAHGLPTTLVTHPRAGHRVVLPGEHVVTGGMRMARGGTPEADRRLGDLLWPHLRSVLSV
jgi:acetyl esterase/lipase